MRFDHQFSVRLMLAHSPRDNKPLTGTDAHAFIHIFNYFNQNMSDINVSHVMKEQVDKGSDLPLIPNGAKRFRYFGIRS